MRIAVALVSTGLSLLTACVPMASAAELRGQWNMNQSGGVVRDRAGSSNLVLTGPYTETAGKNGRAIAFDYRDRPSVGTAMNSARFNPERRPFAVAAYLRTPPVPTGRGYSPNVVQKGLFDDRGQWKMELQAGAVGTVATCRFKGSKRADLVRDRYQTPLNDKRWHKVMCWRFPGSYGITVDGRHTSVNTTLGAISNGRPLRVAIKAKDAGVTDQFQGRLDCVAYAVGIHARHRARSSATC